MSRVKDSDERLIRWFTPTKEVPLCGHATVAASFVLFNENVHENVIKFISNFGLTLDCRKEVDGQLTLNFPLNPTIKMFPEMNSWLPDLCEAVLGPELVQQIIDHQLSPNTKKLVIRLKDDLPDEVLENIRPDFNRMKANDNGEQVYGFVVTQKSNFKHNGLHFRSRYFAPWAGIDEDPVTGSSFTALTPYWSEIYAQNGENVSIFQAKQVSKRGGIVRSKIDDERVFISGSAVEFSTGFINL